MSDKTAIVWGAAGGIGGALVNQLSAEGWRVIAVTHQQADVDGAVMSVEANVGDEFDVRRAVMAAGQEAPEIDLFIYAVGDITSEPAGKMAPQTWRRIIEANLDGAYYATHYSLPLLTAERAAGLHWGYQRAHASSRAERLRGREGRLGSTCRSPAQRRA